MAALLLCTSMVLSVGRNLLSKNLSALHFGEQAFFSRQAVLFLFGGICIALFGGNWSCALSLQTLLYGIVYGLLLIVAQWFYTAALGGGNMALCSTVYSLGFIIPTLSGAVFWNEPFSGFDLLGVLCAALAIVCSKAEPTGKKTRARGRYFLPLIVAMTASGGLGIMQKLQQRSPVADELQAFLVIAFLLAAGLSFLSSCMVKKRAAASHPKTLWMAAGVGIAFGGCNLLNTTLAGMLPGAVLFPTLNIGVILTTMLCGVILLGERIGKKEICVLALGASSILLLTVF